MGKSKVPRGTTERRRCKCRIWFTKSQYNDDKCTVCKPIKKEDKEKKR